MHSLQDFFQDVANKGVLNLPIAGKDEEDLFESARIYIERSGRPFNYLPTDEEAWLCCLKNPWLFILATSFPSQVKRGFKEGSSTEYGSAAWGCARSKEKERERER